MQTLIILYAPTFRGKDAFNSSYNTNINFIPLKQTIEKKFKKKCVFFMRFHLGQSGYLPTNVINVSSYPDMQELLCATDILITDYSSCMWDFALTYRPGFLFLPDIVQYETERGLYTPISSWPFPYAKTTDDLCRLIENYDDTIAHDKIQRHLDSLGSFENGLATQKICKLIKKQIVYS